MTLRYFAALLLGWVVTAPALAQVPGGRQPGVNAALLKILGEFQNFSSKADVRLVEKADKSPTALTMGFAMRDGNVRLDLDMSSVKSRQMAPDTLVTLKRAGLDKMVTIVRPDRKMATLMYPSAQAYVEMPMSEQEAADLQREYRVEKKRLGRETVERHPCEKQRWILTSDTGEKQEATVWHASDLSGFPVKVEMTQPEATVTMLFSNVKLSKPDARQFEAERSYERHPNIELLMQAAMVKAMSGK